MEKRKVMGKDTLIFIISPVVCAAIGWLTNFLAIKMLFHPREPFKVLFFTLRGIFPRRREALAHNLGQMIERDLISHDDLKKVMTDDEFAQVFRDVISGHVDNFVDNRIGSLNPMIKMFLTDEMRQKVKGMLHEEMDSIIPQMIEKGAAELEERLVFKDIVKEKIEKFSLDKVEDILFSILKKEFKFIELTGGVLGFFIGVFQAAAYYFLG